MHPHWCRMVPSGTWLWCTFGARFFDKNSAVFRSGFVRARPFSPSLSAQWKKHEHCMPPPTALTHDMTPWDLGPRDVCSCRRLGGSKTDWAGKAATLRIGPRSNSIRSRSGSPAALESGQFACQCISCSEMTPPITSGAGWGPCGRRAGGDPHAGHSARSSRRATHHYHQQARLLQ